MFRKKVLLIYLVVLLISCKNEKDKSNSQVKESSTSLIEQTNNYFQILINVRVPKDDTFEIYYYETGSSTFHSKDFVSKKILGNEYDQDILFDLPENMYPERLRLDLGKNVNQDPIKLNSVTLIWNDKKYEFSKEELKNDLRPSKFVIFDKERLIVKTVEVNGRYDPYFYTMNLNNIVDFLLED
ncbi:hypothetical protein [Winogradskyella aurantiaca]|uniref:hypothetical protein n=1 Tax=Winogradskyella aurantiaca TaxID=2219558 RepID=UPI000E1D0E95|nr:hypothetical protein [Winogradskyella aurantiaca]